MLYIRNQLFLYNIIDAVIFNKGKIFALYAFLGITDYQVFAYT